MRLVEFLKKSSPPIAPVRRFRGRPTIGRTAEGRSKLAELADESASRSGRQPSHLPTTRSQVDDWEIKRPVRLERGKVMAVIGRRCAQAKPSIELIPTSRIGANPSDPEHRLETS